MQIADHSKVGEVKVVNYWSAKKSSSRLKVLINEEEFRALLTNN